MINTKYNSPNPDLTGVNELSNWTLFSNHGHVLVCLSRDPEARLRDVAADVGITERAVQKIVRDLQDADMLSVTKTGRRNTYRIHGKTGLRHTLEADCTLKNLLKVINKAGMGKNKPARTKQHDTRKKPDRVVNIDPDSNSRSIKPRQKVDVSTRGRNEPEVMSRKDGKGISKGKKHTVEDKEDTSDLATKKDKQQGTLF